MCLCHIDGGCDNKMRLLDVFASSSAVDPSWPAGSQLEAGDLKGLSSTLSSSWVEEFQRATAVLDASEAEKAQAAAIFDSISNLKVTASSGDLKGSKQKFVALVAALEDWATSTGLAANLKGL